MGFNTREDNIEIFENTVDICSKNETLKSAIKASRAAQKLILENDSVETVMNVTELSAAKNHFEKNAQIIVSKNSLRNKLEVAQKRNSVFLTELLVVCASGWA